jgi:hypothetical protein
VVEPYCAKEAVRLFREQTAYPNGSVDKDVMDLEEAINEDESSSDNSTPYVAKQPKKKLTWTAETPQETGHTTTHRYNRPCMFWYNPHSPHACQDEEGWYDTSHMRDHIFALSQCRILRFVWSPGADYTRYFDHDTTAISPEGTNFRRFGNNEHTRRLQSMVLQWLHTLQESEKWLKYLKTTADVFLVLKRDWSEEMNLIALKW